MLELIDVAALVIVSYFWSSRKGNCVPMASETQSGHGR